MDPEAQEVKNMMVEMLKLTRENNEMLLKVYRKQKWAQIYKFIHWFIIIGIAFGGVFLVKPYLNNLLNYYEAVAGEGSALDTLNPSNGIPNVNRLQEILKQVNGN